MGEMLKNSKTPVRKDCSMNDCDMLNDVLLSYKQLVSNYATALNEASNKNIYKLYFYLFESSSKLQANLFQLSFEKGWYQLETADETKIEKAFEKYSKCLTELGIKEKNSSK